MCWRLQLLRSTPTTPLSDHAARALYCYCYCTVLQVYRRYLKLEPMHSEEFIAYLLIKQLWGEAARVRLRGVLGAVCQCGGDACGCGGLGWQGIAGGAANGPSLQPCLLPGWAPSVHQGSLTC